LFGDAIKAFDNIRFAFVEARYCLLLHLPGSLPGDLSCRVPGLRENVFQSAGLPRRISAS
jgi:hypothetical protein